MMSIFYTRLLHWKKQWRSLLFWLFVPLVSTVLIIHFTSAIQEDSKIPVGIVMEEQTELAYSLLESIKASPLIRVYEMSEAEAKNSIESHELDSAFIIEKGYEDKVLRGNRNSLITSYKSELSFAYIPVSEMIASLVQEITGKSKAAHEIINLANQLQIDKPIHYSDIIAKSTEVQEQENLLFTTFSFKDSVQTKSENNVINWNIWGLWCLLSILSTLLLFDWVIKERNAGILPRFAFIRFSFKSYLLLNLAIYTAVLLLFDSVAVFVFQSLLSETVNLKFIGALIVFRIIVSAASFLIALLFENIYLYYSAAFVIFLFLAITSGAVLPIEGVTNRFPWLASLNPLDPFLKQELWNPWLAIVIAFIFIWFAKGEKYNA